MGNVTIAAVGDIMLGSTWPSRAKMPEGDGARLLLPVTSLLKGAQITFGNLEGPLCDGGTVTPGKANAKNSYAFRSPTKCASFLKNAGFDIVSVANNHASDFQAFGRKTTLDALGKYGIVAVGRNPSDIATMRAGGQTIRFVAFATNRVSANLNEIAAAKALVARAKSMGGLMVVSFHGGAEGSARQRLPRGPETFFGEARGDLRRFAHACVDSGADLVLGHGPHVLRAMEVYKNRLIAYSLGNFATYGWISVRGEGGVTCVLSATLAPDGRFVSGKVHPVRQLGEGGPRPDPTGAAIRTLRRLNAADIGKSAPNLAPDGTLSAR